MFTEECYVQLLSFMKFILIMKYSNMHRYEITIYLCYISIIRRKYLKYYFLDQIIIFDTEKVS